MINQFDGDQNKSESQVQGSGAAGRPSAVWVKPTIERINLREALLTGLTNNASDSPNHYS